ncbi:MAG TPA: hypothetical protein DDZ81_18355, partial [Acetobacteraceae bacterium]|nr:hypothetical protein [Acetobacteraceae bacterium]
IQPNNTIGVLGTFNDGAGTFTLNDAVALSQTGTLTAGLMVLNDTAATLPSIAFGGVVNVGTLDLNAANGVTQTGGLISAAQLQSSSGVAGDVVLGQSGNAITTLANFNDGTGAFTLVDSHALTQVGTLTAGSVKLTDSGLSAPSLTLSGTVIAGVLDLNASAGIDQTGGVINAGTLQSSAGVTGTVSLAQSGNTIGVLGSFNDGSGSFTLADSVALTQTGTLSAGRMVLADTSTGSPAITLSGIVTGGTLDLTSAAGVEQTGGTIAVNLLQSSGGVTGAVSLGQAGNHIGTLGTFNDGSATFTLVDASALSQTGTLTAGLAVLNDTNTTAPSLSFGGIVNVATLDVSAAAGIAQTGGAITAAQLQSSNGVAGTVVLGQAGNAIGTLANFSVGGGSFTLRDSAALTQAGTLTAGFAALSDSNATAPSLTLTGLVNAGTLDLSAAAGIAQTGGVINATQLQSTGGVTGTVSLIQPNNTIGTIAAFSDHTGTFALSDGAPLTVTGPLTAGSIALHEFSPAPSALTVAGVMTGSSAINLTTNGADIVETPGGVISTPLLTASVPTGASVSLLGTANAITGVGNVNASGGTLTILDSVNPNIAGVLSAASISVTDNGIGGITATGTISGTTTVSLNTAGGGVQASAAVIETPLLISTTGITGNAVLTNTGNAIAAVGGLTVSGGGLQIYDAGNLTLSGPVSVAQGAVLTASGGLTIAGNLSAPGQAITLASGGAINQTAGVITADTLFASGQSVGLAPGMGSGPPLPGNQIGTVGSIASAGAVSLLNAAPLQVGGPVHGTYVSLLTEGAGSTLTVAGPVTGSSGVTLSAANGDVVLDAAVTTPGVLTLISPLQSIVQTGGAISANTVTGSAGADITLGSAANTIASLGPVSVAGNLVVADTGVLQVTGPVQASNASLSATAGINLAGDVSAGTLDLATASGGVSQSGGSLVLNTLSAIGGVSGGATFGGGSNQIASLGGFTVSNGNFVLADIGDLAVAGALVAPNISITTPASITLPGAINTGTLNLQIGGGIVRPASAGAFTVGTLTGDVAGQANFGTGTDITTLGQFTVTGPSGTLALSNAASLAVTGPINAAYIAVTATDLLTLTGTITTTGAPLATQAVSTTPVDPGSYFAVVSSPNGGAPAIRQTGILQVQPSSDAQTATLRLDFAGNGGSITLNNLSGPQTSLILYTRTGGSASGTINVNALRVVGSDGQSALFGTVANAGGSVAAYNSTIRSSPSANYRVNGCPITSVNCVLLPIGILPSIDPLRDFNLSVGEGSGDEDLALPDVSNTDY